MRLIYTLAWLALLPIAFLYLLWRSRRQPEYRQHWSERLGRVTIPDQRPLIWLHAVSVGETQAAKPLVQALLERYPDHALLLTHATPTGRATGSEIFASRVMQAYLPYDLPWAVAEFLERARPRIGIFMETEIWPNLFAACQARHVPVFLVNARMSPRSANGYRKLAALTRSTLARLSGIAAQTAGDAERLASLGARDIQVSGNLKFDVQPPHDTQARTTQLRGLFPQRFVVLAASTREGEEALLLDCLAKLRIPGLLLVIVPRHPQRFDTVAELLHKRGTAFVRRSEDSPVPTEVPVLLGDSMGEMAAYYAACDVAFVGGSLLPLGGQNLIEAAAAGRPSLIGPHTWNFQAASDQAVAAGAALRIQSVEELTEGVQHLHDHPEIRLRMGEAGLAFAVGHRGATERIMEMLAPALAGPAGQPPTP